MFLVPSQRKKPSSTASCMRSEQIAKPSNHRSGSASLAHGRVAQKAKKQSPDPFRPRLPVHQHQLGFIPEATQSRTLNEPTRQLSRQRRGRKLLQPSKARTSQAQNLQNQKRREARYFRLHRDVLQSGTQKC